MTRPGLALPLGLLCCAVGCLNLGQDPPDKLRYVLVAERSGAAATLDAGSLRMDRVRVAPQFERKAFVYQTGETTYQSDFYNEFYSPPGQLIRQLLGQWMVDSDIFSTVLGATDPTPPDWLLEGRADALYADLRDPRAPQVHVTAEFTLLDAKSIELQPSFKKVYSASTSARSGQPRSLVEAWSTALTEIFRELERDLLAHLRSVAGPH